LLPLEKQGKPHHHKFFNFVHPTSKSMRNLLVPPLAVGAALAFFSVPCEAALLLYYNFEGAQATDGALIDNLVAGQPDGTLRFGTAGGTVSFVPGGTVTGGNLGQSLSLTPAAENNANLAAPHVDTAFTATQLSLTPTTAYTAMAWVNFANISGTSGDNMIFGQNSSATPPATGDVGVLHLGARNGGYHSGHWGDDLSGGTPTAGTWQHVAFTNDTAGLQKIYLNGVEVASGPGNATNPLGGGLQVARNILIGTSGNGGSFSGQLDEIKVYNETLDAAQIQQASVIPEPSSLALLALATAGVGMLRRRRP
jgi:hypothetical protein